MTPESALELIPEFENATIGITLSDGVTAKTVLLHRDDQQYVLRVDKPAARELGLNRAGEEEIVRLVSSAGLSPKPVYFNHDQGIYLREFVGGTNWVVSDLQDKRELKRLASRLVELHDLPSVKAQYDPVSAIRRYAAQIGTAEAAALEREALGLAERLGSGWQSCLCHNDLLNHNIMESDTLLLIDWEFAGMGDPYFDLAVIVEHHDLTDRLAKAFLKFYLGRRPDKQEFERLLRQRRFYELLLQLWCKVTNTSKAIHVPPPEDRAELPG